MVHGRAAHAAANPEAGVNAIAVAAEIVAALPLGRRPGGGSVNVAAIVGGSVIDRLTPEAIAERAAWSPRSTPRSPTPFPTGRWSAARFAATTLEEIEDHGRRDHAHGRPHLRGPRRAL